VRFRKDIKTVIVSIMLGVFTLLVINYSLNIHQHVASGFLYSHAHPFNKAAENPINSHSHTVPELIALDLLTDSDFLQLVMIGCFIAFAGFMLVKVSSVMPAIHTRIAGIRVPRAPPI